MVDKIPKIINRGIVFFKNEASVYIKLTEKERRK